MALTFPRFSSLPAELRDRIWRDTLPTWDGPRLFWLKTGLWTPYSECDESQQGHTNCNLNTEFNNQECHPVQVDLPLLLVNNEARRIALTWAFEQGIEMSWCSQRQCHVFGRGFYPDQDVLYISNDQWNPASATDYYDMVDSLHLNSQWEMCLQSSCIAIQESMLRGYNIELRDILNLLSGTTIVYVITGMSEDPKRGPKATPNCVQRCWELVSPTGAALVWNQEKRDFELRGEASIEVAAVHRRIEESRVFHETFRWGRRRPLEIRPVFAIRK